MDICEIEACYEYFLAQTNCSPMFEHDLIVSGQLYECKQVSWLGCG